LGRLTPEDRDALKIRLNRSLQEAIVARMPIMINMQQDMRDITIAGFAATSCGGTHVQNLGELQAVEISKIKVKNSEIRIAYTISDR